MAAKKPTMGELIDGIWAKRESKRALEESVKKIEEEIKGLEEMLMEAMDKEGVDKSTGKKASVSIATSVVANIVDWDKLCAFVKKTGHFHLFQRRVSDPAAREIFESIPKAKLGATGLEPFVKRKLNVRTLS